MKKIISFIAAAALLCTAPSCSKKTGTVSESGESAVTSAVTEAEDTAPAVETSAETKTSAGTSTTVGSAQTAVSTAASVTSAVTTAAPDPHGTDVPGDSSEQGRTDIPGGSGGGFTYNSDGAVTFSVPISDQSDSTLIAAAQALFESACNTDWSFTVGTPYTIDESQYVENEFGWQYYLVTTSGVNSLADVESDYYKVFSSRYPTALSEVFMEDGGHVYALNGARGMNIFYNYSQITGITSRSDDEVFFTVVNYYDGEPYGGPEAYTQEEEFSAVMDGDGVWRAGVFRLPY